MANFWMVKKDNIIYICPKNPEEKKVKENKLEMHKLIIQALKEARGK